MVPPAWCKAFTEFEYADKGRGPRAFDCWGFVRHVLAEQFGIKDMPDLSAEYASAEDHPAVAQVVEKYERALAATWRPVRGEPQAGDIVMIKIAGLPWHCGVVVGGSWMMHILKGVNVGLEYFTREPWRNRIEGIYRHV